MTQAVSGDKTGNKAFEFICTFAQFFFGGWFVFHGLNYFIHFWPQPKGSSVLMREVIMGLIHSGLFDVIKGIEVVTGLMLLANRMVPIAAILAFPVSFSIAYLNVMANHDAYSFGVAVCIIAINGLIVLGHLDKFLPLLVFNNGDPKIDGLKQFLAQFKNK